VSVKIKAILFHDFGVTTIEDRESADIFRIFFIDYKTHKIE